MLSLDLGPPAHMLTQNLLSLAIWLLSSWCCRAASQAAMRRAPLARALTLIVAVATFA